MRILAVAEQSPATWPRAVDRVLERGLEAATDVDDELGVANRLDVARRELDVVRLDTGRREVDDVVDCVGCDAARRPREWIERGDDARASVPLLVAAAAGDQQDESCENRWRARRRR